MKALLPRLGLLLAVALAFAGAARAAEVDPALVEAARKEGTVSWYSTLIVNQIVRPLAEAFEAKYPGITVRYARATASDTALKIINEARARRLQADLFDGSSTIYPLQAAGLVASYAPRAAQDYPAEFRDPAGLWTVANLFFLTTCFNTSLVSAADAPQTYDDLLDPKWKGKIAWTNDLTTGGPPGFIYNALARLGPDKGMDYMRKFAAQQPVSIPASQRVVLDKVIAGEYELGVMTFNYHAAISAEQGAPVAWIRMEPLLETFNLISIVKDSPHPAAARLLVEFILSDEGQKVMADNNYMPASPRVAARIPTLKPEAGGFKVISITPEMVRTGLQGWIDRYHELFR